MDTCYLVGRLVPESKSLIFRSCLNLSILLIKRTYFIGIIIFTVVRYIICFTEIVPPLLNPILFITNLLYAYINFFGESVFMSPFYHQLSLLKLAFSNYVPKNF